MQSPIQQKFLESEHACFRRNRVFTHRQGIGDREIFPPAHNHHLVCLCFSRSVETEITEVVWMFAFAAAKRDKTKAAYHYAVENEIFTSPSGT